MLSANPAVATPAANTGSTSVPVVSASPASESRGVASPFGAPAASSGMPAATGLTATPASRGSQPAQPAPAAVLSPGAPGSAPQAAATPAASAQGAAVPANPFNGAALTPEQLQRELELSRAQTRALEDKLLQSLPPEQARALQARREQEASRAAKPETATKPGVRAEKASKGQPSETTARAADAPARDQAAAPVARKVAVKPKRRAAPVKEVFENDLAGAEDPGRPTLVSIVAVGSRHSVIFEVDGRTFTALDGELTPFGRLTVWDESCIDLGETRLRLTGGRMR